MKIFEVDFEGMWPVGNCLIIAANNFEEANFIAAKTISHTKKFKVKEVDVSESKVIVYLSGDY